jgi:hypothetical protein
MPRKARKIRPTTTSRRPWLSGDLVMIAAKPLHLIRVKGMAF